VTLVLFSRVAWAAIETAVTDLFSQAMAYVVGSILIIKQPAAIPDARCARCHGSLRLDTEFRHGPGQSTVSQFDPVGGQARNQHRASDGGDLPFSPDGIVFCPPAGALFQVISSSNSPPPYHGRRHPAWISPPAERTPKS
jgi:hypothetical protein